MIKVSDISLVDGNVYQGKFSFYDSSGKHKTSLFWECVNPGQQNPLLFFFTRKREEFGRELIFCINDSREFKDLILSGKEKNEFHIKLFRQRKTIYSFIGEFIKNERIYIKKKSIK